MSTVTLASQHALFDLPSDVSYLNCAYQSPKLRQSIAASELELHRNSRPWTISSEDFFGPAERLRTLFARLIDAEPADIAIVPSVSYGIAVAAANLPVNAGEHIVVLAEQFPSNLYAWRELVCQPGSRLTFVERPADGGWTEHVIDRIDTRCAITALPGVHWTDGYRLDLEAIGKKCRNMGSALVLDLTQSLGVMPFSVRKIEVDFVAVASYKWLLGPLGLSFLYVNPKHHQGRPIEYGWLGRLGSEDFSRLVDYTEEYQPGARRFDAGERTNNSLIVGATTALEQILEWGTNNIQNYLSKLIELIALKSGQRGLKCTPPEARAPHLLGIELPEDRITKIATGLANEKVYASVRGNKLRVAPYLYNSERDVERLFEVMDRFL
jgi:selenocysteine lyase/cysteine desulfurase